MEGQVAFSGRLLDLSLHGALVGLTSSFEAEAIYRLQENTTGFAVFQGPSGDKHSQVCKIVRLEKQGPLKAVALHFPQSLQDSPLEQYLPEVR